MRAAFAVLLLAALVGPAESSRILTHIATELGARPKRDKWCIASEAAVDCGENSTIAVLSAFYSKPKKASCTPDNTEGPESCAENGKKIVSDACDGKQSCKLPPSFHPVCKEERFTYLRIVWECVALTQSEKLALIAKREAKDREAKELADRLAKEELERIAKEKAEREAKEEERRKAKELADRLAQEELNRIAKEKAEREAKEEERRKAKELADRLAQEEADRIAKEKAEREAKEEERRKAKELADRLAQQERDRIAKELADRKAKEEAAYRAKFSTQFKVWIRTSNDAWSGTNSDVWVVLKGDGGQSGWVLLDDSWHDDFERGDGRWYTFTSNNKILPVDACFWKNGSDGWKPERLLVCRNDGDHSCYGNAYGWDFIDDQAVYCKRLG